MALSEADLAAQQAEIDAARARLDELEQAQAAALFQQNAAFLATRDANTAAVREQQAALDAEYRITQRRKAEERERLAAEQYQADCQALMQAHEAMLRNLGRAEAHLTHAMAACLEAFTLLEEQNAMAKRLTNNEVSLMARVELMNEVASLWAGLMVKALNGSLRFGNIALSHPAPRGQETDWAERIERRFAPRLAKVVG